MDLLKGFLIEAAKWTREEFTQAWNELPSRQDVATRFGITPEYASVVANQLRGLGYELKKHPKGVKLGATRTRELPKGELPPKAEIARMWNEDPSITRLSTRLGIPADALKRILIQLKNEEGMDISRAAAPGRKARNAIDPKMFVAIWQKSDRLDDVIEKLRGLGYEIPQDSERAYVTSIASRINKERVAQGKEKLKKLERKAYYKAFKFAEEPRPGDELPDDYGAEPEGMGDVEGFADVDVDQPAGSAESWEDVPSEEDVGETPEEPESPSEYEEPGESDSDREFVDAWNSAESFRDAIQNLRDKGWELSKEEIKAKARVLRVSGFPIKKFE